MNRKLPRKIPPEAFEDYMSLGLGRSYTILAKKYGVTKRAITYRAAEEHWQERIDRIEEEVRREAERKLIDELSELRATHIRTLRLLTVRAIEALKEHKLTSAMEGAKVAEIAIRLERMMLGETTDERGGSVERVTREEIDRLLAIEAESEAREIEAEAVPGTPADNATTSDDLEDEDDW